MKTNNVFSLPRFLILIKQSFRINKKTIGISLAGISGTLFILLMLLQRLDKYEYWTNKNYFDLFLVFFFALGIIYTSLSFPAFRSKEKSMVYLTLPINAFEKYTFELVTRIVAFILFMPLLFWVIANIEGSIVHYYAPKLINYKFSFSQAIAELNNSKPVSEWMKLAIIQSILFVFIAAFAGASHFKRLPLIKSLFTFAVVVIGFLLYIYILSKGLNLKEYTSSEHGVLFIKDEKGATAFYALGAMVVNISLLAFAWFRLKEKEV